MAYLHISQKYIIQVLTEAVYTAVPALPRPLPSEHNLHISRIRAAGRGPAGETGEISPEIN